MDTKRLIVVLKSYNANHCIAKAGLGRPMPVMTDVLVVRKKGGLGSTTKNTIPLSVSKRPLMIDDHFKFVLTMSASPQNDGCQL